MKTRKYVRGVLFVLLLMGLSGPEWSLAQPAPPAPPSGQMLDAWTFAGTNYLSFRHVAPLSLTNVALVPTWEGNGLQIDASDPAWIVYPVFGTNGHLELSCTNGSVEFWISPDWNSSDGLGDWATVLEVGVWSTNLSAATGAWGLYISPDGSNLCFSAQTNGTSTNYLNAPISWSAGEWHQIALTYSVTNSALYLDGQLATNGPGVSIIPGASVLTNGFSVGSDGFSTGLLQSRSIFNQLITYNYQLDGETISNNYDFDLQFVGSVLVSGGGMDIFSPPDPPGDGGTNSGGGSFTSPSYSANDFWIEPLAPGTNVYNADANTLTFLLHGTIADAAYELLSTTNLQPTGTVWIVEKSLVGSVTTNFTAITIPLGTGPQKFFKALAYTQDSDGDGLPDWWELKYSTTDHPLSPTNSDTGNTGIQDGAKLDSAGDGYSNLQKYQMGIPPDVFVAPPAPSGLTVVTNSNGTVSLTWDPSLGPVTSYIIKRADPHTNSYGFVDGMGAFQTVTTTTNSSFIDTNVVVIGNPLDPDNSFGSQYEIQANYPGGASQITISAMLGSISSSPYAVNANLVRGPYGRWQLVFSAIPSSVQNIEISYDGYFYWYDSLFYDGSPTQTIAVSNLVNGCYIIPDNIVTNYVGFNEWIMDYGPAEGWSSWYNAGGDWAYEVLVRGQGTNGAFGPYVQAGIITQDAPYFMDGRQELEESLAFLMEAANVSKDFHVVDQYDQDYFFSTRGSNFIEHSFIHPAVTEKGYGITNIYPTFFIAVDNLWPFMVDYELAKWLYSTNSAPSFAWQPDFTTPAPVLATNGSFQSGPYWIQQDANDLGDVSATKSNNGNTVSLASGTVNSYGLPYGDALCVGSGVDYDGDPIINPSTGLPDYPPEKHALSPGSSINFTNGALAYFYSQVQAPVLHTVGYYFAPVNSPGMDVMGLDSPVQKYSLPLSSNFSVSTETPLIIGAVGQSMIIGAWAKQTITNGSSGKYVYLGQYFQTNAYKATNGTATTNTTGIISPYGEFFPTEPGSTALLTMPDLHTGQVGTNIINVIKLQLDVNHDGKMDLSFTGPDNTYANRPFKFWANNDYDRSVPDSDDGTNYEDSVLVAGCPYTPYQDTRDNNYRDASGRRVIPTKRDLQDFTRLWLAGITTNLLTNLPAGSTITLSWGDVGSPNTNNPIIDLFAAADPDGGMGYLTNETIAIQQTNINLCPYIGRLGPGQSIQLNASTFSNSWAGNHFIWCGEGYGSGALTLTIADASSNVLAQTVAYIQIVDIKQMYERWTVGDNLSIAPTNHARLAEDNFPPGLFPTPFQYGPATDTNTSYILYVHGWNMASWDKDRFAESAFKRLYWQGYQGRFGVFRWPTGYGFTGLGTIATNINEKDNYDSSEFNAWQSGNGLLNKLEDLNAQYPGRVYLLAHSMGNVVAGEALRLSSSQVVNTYVASQGAVSAHTYDTNVPDYSFTYAGLSFGPDTPNIYGGWFASNYGGGAANIINFYNTNDFALARGHWQLNQLVKPDHSVLEGTNTWTYGYTGSPTDGPPWNNFIKTTSGGGYVAFFITTSISARYEVMAYAAESYTTALGATPGVGNIRRNVDLTRVSSPIWPSDPNNYVAHFWHSAEFRGDNALQGNYWNELLGSEAFNLK